MRLRSGHVTWLEAEFHPQKYSPVALIRPGRPRVRLCPKFLVLGVFHMCTHLGRSYLNYGQAIGMVVVHLSVCNGCIVAVKKLFTEIINHMC